MREVISCTSHKLRILVGVLLALLLGVALTLSGSLAVADNLTDQKNATQAKIDQNQADITKAQADLQKAQDAVSTAKKNLAAAQDTLAQKQQAKSDAQAEDSRLAANLADAQSELAARQADVQAAQEGVAKGEANLTDQRNNIGLVAQTTAQQNTALVSISLLLTGLGTSQIADQVQWASSAFTASQNAMDQLLAAQKQLEDAQTAAQQAQDAAASAEAAVQTQKDAAAEHLGVTKQAEADAQAAADAVDAQVTANQQAQDAAQKALDAANAEQKQLQDDMNQILAQIQKELDAAKKANDQTNKAAPTTGTFFVRPVPGRVTSPFGWRIHPITHKPQFHMGVDFGANCGTPILASEAGKVSIAGWYGGLGNYVLINHGKIGGNSYSTGYGHQSKVAVHVGQTVKRGQVIGYVGTTGVSTGCHVHYNVFKNGKAINGLPLVS